MKLVLRGKLRHVKKFFSSLSIGISIKPKGVRSWEQDSTEKPGKQRNDLIDDSIPVKKAKLWESQAHWLFLIGGPCRLFVIDCPWPSSSDLELTTLA